jgi:hypothetical protein
VLGPPLGGTALAHVSWEWLLIINAPIAPVGCIGVRLGVPPEGPEDLRQDRLDLPGAALLTVSLTALPWSVDHSYFAIAACMVAMTIGLRTVMTLCAVALVEAMPVAEAEDPTSQWFIIVLC